MQCHQALASVMDAVRMLDVPHLDWMMAVSIQLDPFRVEAPRKLFEFPSTTFNFDQNFADYDIAPDGRFLAIQADSVAADEIHVVLNWTEELRRALGR